ncbi:hypothetical protein D3C74_80640 [compost metagenome]
MLERSIELRPFEEKDIGMIEPWFRDHEVQLRLEGMGPLGKWFHCVKQNSDYYVWLAIENDQTVGMAMVEAESNVIGNVALVVNPSLWSRGYGRAILKKVLFLPEMDFIKKWVAGIEEDNTASLKCFQSEGFSFEGSQTDEDGFYSLIQYK